MCRIALSEKVRPFRDDGSRRNRKDSQMLTTLHRHPGRVLLGLFAAMVVLFLLSASGQEDAFWKNGPGWLGAIGWFGFLLTTLAMIVTLVYLGVRTVRQRRSPELS